MLLNTCGETATSHVLYNLCMKSQMAHVSSLSIHLTTVTKLVEHAAPSVFDNHLRRICHSLVPKSHSANLRSVGGRRSDREALCG